MNEQALAWAAAALESQIHDWQRMTGGLTSTMLALTHDQGEAVLRLMTVEPWRSHGPELTRREQAAFGALNDTRVPAPETIALDPEGAGAGVAAHLMTRLPGSAAEDRGDLDLVAMATMLSTIHAVRPREPFREFQSWAWDAKWHVPAWSSHPATWERAFELLATDPPRFDPTFLHRDFSHRNLLWQEGAISGVVDWVETSTGPADLDAAHAASNLAIAFGIDSALDFLGHYSELTGADVARYWLVMDAVGFLPVPGRAPMFADPTELARLDDWLHTVIGAG